jgi:hypothetical protein
MRTTLENSCQPLLTPHASQQQPDLQLTVIRHVLQPQPLLEQESTMQTTGETGKNSFVVPLQGRNASWEYITLPNDMLILLELHRLLLLTGELQIDLLITVR